MKKVISMKVLFKSNIRFLKVIYLVPWYLRHDNKCQTFVYKTVANIVFTFNSLATLYIWQLCTSGNSVHLAILYIWLLYECIAIKYSKASINGNFQKTYLRDF